MSWPRRRDATGLTRDEIVDALILHVRRIAREEIVKARTELDRLPTPEEGDHARGT